MDETFLDELVEYPAKALQLIGTSQPVLSLLTDNPLIETDSQEAADVFDNYLFDYTYVDETTTEAKAFVCVEADVTRLPNQNIKDVRLFVTIICHKQYMKLNPTKFVGMIGNRRDNLVREVDKLLDGSDVFGIGALKLVSAKAISSPTGFSARELTYFVPDFHRTKGGMVL